MFSGTLDLEPLLQVEHVLGIHLQLYLNLGPQPQIKQGWDQHLQLVLDLESELQLEHVLDLHLRLELAYNKQLAQYSEVQMCLQFKLCMELALYI